MSDSLQPWPWFLGAAALGLVAVVYTAVTRRGFGVSGHVGRVVSGESRRASSLFLAGIAGGGLVAAVTSGGLSLRATDASFVHLFGSGALSWAALAVGGVLVGVGTAWAGGCTSGHGLVGCARLQPGSLVATACFLGTAVLVSFALARVLA